MYHLTIKPGQLTLAQLREISRSAVQISLDPACYDNINASTKIVNQVIAEDRVAYGINTGFGLLANTRIAPEDLEILQRSIVLSHAAGIGKFMSDETVRLMMVLKINSLARGFSGIRLSVIKALIHLVNSEVYPCVPKKGSVGASGDLAPLAHMSTVLLGEGEAQVCSSWSVEKPRYRNLFCYPGKAGEVSRRLLTLRRNTYVRLFVTLIWLQFGHKVDKNIGNIMTLTLSDF